MMSGRRGDFPLHAAEVDLAALVLCALPIVREGILHLIRARFGGELRAAGADGWAAHAAAAAAGRRFDVVLVHRGGAFSPAGLSRIAAAAQNSTVIVVGPQAGAHMHALPAVVRGVTLGAPIEEWCGVLRSAIDDARRRVTAKSPARAAAGNAAGRLPGAVAQLTPRQRDVFNMLCIGLSNRGIAEQLGLSIGTVKLHVAAILQTLNAKRRVELVLRRAGMQHQLGGRAGAPLANHPNRPAQLPDALADDRSE